MPAVAPAPADEIVPSAGLHPHLAPLALFAAVTALVSWPTIPKVGAAIPGGATSDVYDHFWGYAWWASSLAAGRLPLFTETSHWPQGGALWFIDPVGALLSLPFQALFGASVGFSAAVLLQLWGGMAAAYAVAFAEVRARGPAVLAAVIFGASPYALSLLHSGTVEYLTLAPLPLFWWAARRAIAEGGRRCTLLAAGAWSWATLGNFYYAAFVSLLLGIAVVAARDGRWTTLRRAVGIALVYGVLAAPIFAVAGWTLTAESAAVMAETAPGWNYRAPPATDILTFLHPGEYYFPDTRKLGNNGIIHVNYLGWVATVLALVGAWRLRAWRLPLLLAMVIALGPSLAFLKEPVRIAGTQFPLPDSLLYFPGSPFRFVHHPYRLVVIPMLLGGLAAAHALATRPRLALALSGVVLAETLFVSPAVWPIPTADTVAPAWYTRARDDDSIRGIWDFPPDNHVGNRKWQAWAVTHGKKIPYGVNLFLPRAFVDNHLYRTLMHCMRRPERFTIAREAGRPLAEFTQRPDPTLVEAGRAQLHEWGFDRVVVHIELLQPNERTCVDTALGGAIEKDGTLAIYRVAAAP